MSIDAVNHRPADPDAPMPNLRVNFAGLECVSPIWTASGTFGYGK